MRVVSNDIQTILDSDYGETRDLVQIKIAEQLIPPFPEVIFYLTNGSDIDVDGETYQNGLRNISTIKFSLGHNADTAELIVQNVDKQMGLTLNDTTRMIDNAEVIIKKGF